MSSFAKAYGALTEVYADGAYVNIALKRYIDDIDKKLVVKLVYGVLEHHFELQYVVAALTERLPKLRARLAIMIGAYALKYLNTAEYAVLNECVKLVYDSEKGFVNAVLRKIAGGEYPQPTQKQRGYEETTFNLPQWIINKIKGQYPKSYKKIFAARGSSKEHLRLAYGAKPEELLAVAPDAVASDCGYFVTINDDVIDLLDSGRATVQAVTSMLAVLALGDVCGLRVADVCAAPGGKAVFLAERGADVFAYDIHPHRAGLIKSYAARMNQKLHVLVADATKFDKNMASFFDIVVADVPCSGLGMLKKRQDLILHKEESHLRSLVSLQRAILDNAAKYVAPNGRLLYSTCTILREENEGVTQDFLQRNPQFELMPLALPFANSGEVQYLPDSSGQEGFYICQMKRR